MEQIDHIKVEPDLIIDDYNTTEYHHFITDGNDNIEIKSYFSNGTIKDENEDENETEAIIDNCDKSFQINTSKKYNVRSKAATTTIRFDCTECKKDFTYKSQLKRHIIQVHTMVKPFKCDICAQTFVDKYYIRIHMQTHSGIKPYKCKVCGKYFSYSFNIKKHMLVHSGLRPHKCPKCTKTYKHLSHLKRHIKHHTMMDDDDDDDGDKSNDDGNLMESIKYKVETDSH